MFRPISLLFFFLLAAVPAFSQDNSSKVLYSDEEMTISALDADTYLVVHSFPWPANSLAVRYAKNNFLLIDTPYTDEATEKLVKFLQKDVKGKISITAVNTHFHVDNLGGNGYLKKIGAVTCGSDMTVKLLKERGLGNGMLESFNNPDGRKYYDHYKNKLLTPPSRTFDIHKGLNLTFGKEKVEVWYPGEGHTPDNVVVYLPSKQLLFGGCILKSMESRTKGNLGDANVAAWGGSLDNLAKKYPDARIVIPGHGAPGTIGLIPHTKEIVAGR